MASHLVRQVCTSERNGGVKALRNCQPGDQTDIETLGRSCCLSLVLALLKLCNRDGQAYEISTEDLTAFREEKGFDVANHPTDLDQGDFEGHSADSGGLAAGD